MQGKMYNPEINYMNVFDVVALDGRAYVPHANVYYVYSTDTPSRLLARTVCTYAIQVEKCTCPMPSLFQLAYRAVCDSSLTCYALDAILPLDVTWHAHSRYRCMHCGRYGGISHYTLDSTCTVKFAYYVHFGPTTVRIPTEMHMVVNDAYYYCSLAHLQEAAHVRQTHLMDSIRSRCKDLLWQTSNGTHTPYTLVPSVDFERQ